MPDQPTVPGHPPVRRPGDVLDGRYELRGVLGRGGMAEVWRAHDPVLARDVAVKVFTEPSVRRDPAGAARATAEVRILAGLSHPNIVAVFDAAGATAGHFDHLVMELVEGRSLRERLDEGPLPPAEAARVGAELSAGLEYVHERGVVHRDLKPANVLLEHSRRGDRAKLADFGVARLLEGAPLTMVGTTVGTANYLSPEQATGNTVGPPSDVYSLGLVLLECLTGVLAYPGHGVAAASARLHRAPEIPAGLDARWQDLLREMTALDPAARPSTSAVAARLADLAAVPSSATAVLPRPADHTARLSTPAAPGGTSVLPAVAPRDRHRRRTFAVAGAIGVVLAVVLAVALSTGGDDTTPPASPGGSSSTARTGAASSSPTPMPTPTPTTPTVTPTPTPTTSARVTPNPPAQPVPPGQGKKDGKPGKPAKPGKHKP